MWGGARARVDDENVQVVGVLAVPDRGDLKEPGVGGLDLDGVVVRAVRALERPHGQHYE
jgi:hypothetical protein